MGKNKKSNAAVSAGQALEGALEKMMEAFNEALEILVNAAEDADASGAPPSSDSKSSDPEPEETEIPTEEEINEMGKKELKALAEEHEVELESTKPKGMRAELIEELLGEEEEEEEEDEGGEKEISLEDLQELAAVLLENGKRPELKKILEKNKARSISSAAKKRYADIHQDLEKKIEKLGLDS